MWESESIARLHSVPNYMHNLFEGGPFIHKADLKELSREDAKVIPHDDSEIRVIRNALFHEVRPDEHYNNTLRDVIEKKSSRPYAQLPHISLIVDDRYHSISDSGPERFSVTRLLSGGVREALLKSPFWEVYLATRSPKGDRFYAPLRRLVVLEEFFMFRDSVELWHPSVSDATAEEIVSRFVAYQHMRGRPYRLFAARNSLYALDCAVGVGFGQEGVTVLDHRESKLPRTWDRDPGPASMLDPRQQAKVREFAATHNFSGPFWTPSPQ